MPTAKSIGLFALACGSSSATAYGCYSISSSLSDGDGKGGHVGGSGTLSSDVSSTHKSTGDSAAQGTSEPQDQQMRPNTGDGSSASVTGGPSEASDLVQDANPSLSGQAGESASGAGGTLPTGTEPTSGEDVGNQVGGNPSGSPAPVASGAQNGEGETQNPQSVQGTEAQKASSVDDTGGTGPSANPEGDSPSSGGQIEPSSEQSESSSPQGADSSTGSTDQAKTSIQ